MNKQRRNIINDCIAKLEDIKSELDSVRDDEECAKDATPENLQDTDRYYDMESNVDDLDSVIGLLDDAIDSLNEVLER